MVSSKKGSSSSYNVFMSYVTDEGEACGILSYECYSSWVETRKSSLKQPEESFRRVLTAHVCGLIGRKPFPADVEASLLRVLRQKQVWPCFKNSEVTIGVKGFRKTGFHESRRGIFGSNALSSSLSPTSTPSSSSSEKVYEQKQTIKRAYDSIDPLHIFNNSDSFSSNLSNEVTNSNSSTRESVSTCSSFSMPEEKRPRLEYHNGLYKPHGMLQHFTLNGVKEDNEQVLCLPLHHRQFVGLKLPVYRAYNLANMNLCNDRSLVSTEHVHDLDPQTPTCSVTNERILENSASLAWPLC